MNHHDYHYHYQCCYHYFHNYHHGLSLGRSASWSEGDLAGGVSQELDTVRQPDHDADADDYEEEADIHGDGDY